MALAHITPIQAGPGQRRFAANLGSNRWWRVAVGAREYRNVEGARLMVEPDWISPVQGPLPDSALGRTTIAIEEERFDRDNRFVQIMTYRDRDGTGPAVSAIVEAHSASLPEQGLAPIAFGTGVQNPESQFRSHAFGHTSPSLHPNRWTVANRSSQMAFPAIPAIIGAIGPLMAKAVPLLKTVLPKLAETAAPIAGDLIKQFVGGIAGGGIPAPPMAPRPAAPAPGAPPPRAAPAAPSLPAVAPVPQVVPVPHPAAMPPSMAMLPAIGAARAGGLDIQTVSLLLERLTELAAANREGRSRAAGFAQYGTSTALRRRYAAMASRRSRLGGANRAPTSQAMVAPAIAALPLLTKLTPLLQQVLTPETVQSVIAMPNEHMKTIFNGMKDAAKLGIESHEQDLQFLRDINPGVDDPGLDMLLAGLSLASSQRDPGRNWQRAESVSLSLRAARTVPLAGQMVTLLASDQPLRFPLDVELPVDAQGRSPVLKDAVIQLQVKDKETLEVLHQQEWTAEPISTSGPIATVPTIPAAALAGVPRNTDLLFCFALIWSNSRGEARGAPLHHIARLAEGYSFERLVPSRGGAALRLSDEVRFGDYQHIVWTNRLREDARRVRGELTYLFALAEDDMPMHKRLEPKVASRGEEMKRSTREVRVESGFEVSLDALLKLGSVLDPGMPPVDAAMRAALADLNFRKFFDRSGRIGFDFRGAPEDVFVLKAIPTFAMHELAFRKPAGVDELGQITGHEEVSVALPVPVSIDVEVRDPAAPPGSDPIKIASAELFPTKLLREAKGDVS